MPGPSDPVIGVNAPKALELLNLLWRLVSATDTKRVLKEMAEGGLAGGALYDGLVGATARQHKLSLVSCDRRAEPTYRLLGVEYELLSRTPR
jgi:predicted nucleic acid-binding protein